MRNGKHAYLIIAHRNFYVLEKLIKLLDDPNNDIYLHINKKVKDFDFKRFQSIPQKSKIVFVKRTYIQWGGYSQIKCVLRLLETATAKEHDYYHLLSGADLPLKTQAYIHDFFDANYGKEFVHFDHVTNDQSNNARMKYYHFIQDRPETRIGRASLKILNKVIIGAEKFLRINRLRTQKIQLQKGADWFSITHDCARYILSNRELIDKMFRFTSQGDEMFIQTIVWNSKYKANLYNKSFNDDYKSCMRYVDWNRGKPYVLRLEDFDELVSSGFLFARKFDSYIDKNIVKKIYNHLMPQQNHNSSDEMVEAAEIRII